jgi:ADP-ribose pyrophosphatase
MLQGGKMVFEVVNSTQVYKGKVFNVRQDQVRMPTGKIVSLDIVDHHGAVAVVPVDELGQIWFIRQYRYAAGQELLELPAGVLEESESPDEAAGREIREEIGMAAGELKRVGGYFLAPGYSTEYLHVFLATHLSPSPLPQDEDELIVVEKIPVEKAYKMAQSGQLSDSKSLAALLLVQAHLH